MERSHGGNRHPVHQITARWEKGFEGMPGLKQKITGDSTLRGQGGFSKEVTVELGPQGEMARRGGGAVQMAEQQVQGS